MFDGLSNFVNSFDTTFLVVLIVCVFFLTLITVLMLVFVFKYSRKKNPRGTNIHGNVALEITWTAIPTILVLIMFWFGWENYLETVNVPENAMPVKVTAQMWKWSFEYEDGKKTDQTPMNQNQKLRAQEAGSHVCFPLGALRF